MRLFLDDVREAPAGWMLTRNPLTAMSLLQSGEIQEISLDHDLAFYVDGKEITGNDVLCYIEQLVHERPGFYPPVIHVHSANVSARRKMELGILAISKAVREG